MTKCWFLMLYSSMCCHESTFRPLKLTTALSHQIPSNSFQFWNKKKIAKNIELWSIWVEHERYHSHVVNVCLKLTLRTIIKFPSSSYFFTSWLEIDRRQISASIFGYGVLPQDFHSQQSNCYWLATFRWVHTATLWIHFYLIVMSLSVFVAECGIVRKVSRARAHIVQSQKQTTTEWKKTTSRR